PAEQEASGSPPEGGLVNLLGVQVFPLCPAPSIDTTGGISARTCLSEASFRARRSLGRRAGKSGARAVSFGSFSFPGKKMNKPNNKITPRIGRTAPDPTPEVDGLDRYQSN
ncbi:MAG: hypothetical protein QNI97_14620, partial [Desulfobacterales bacterium]|nr:hypothetical protein [Desulfobacterales bacterium]